jgi:tetrapyrrole methylase family protein/MazG family protein
MPGSLTIVGLGPGDPGLRTVATQQALERADQIILRTAIHPGLDDLVADPRTTTCDDLYQRATSFDGVYEAIVDRVLASSQVNHVVYAVPGHPLYGERTVAPLEARASEAGIPTMIFSAVGALDAISLALGVDPMAEQAQLLDAVALDAWLQGEQFGGGLLDVVSSRPILVNQVYSRQIASSVKLALSRVFPEDHPVIVVDAAGVPGQQRLTDCPLHDLDHLPVDHLTSVWIPALPILAATRSATTLHRLAGILRSPGGCPWDREQTHRSLREAVIEEAYEVVDAIDEADSAQLAEELGDLLLQVALHAQIAEESGDFTIEEVYDHVNRKLVRRHPHVFGDAAATTASAVIATWQGIKAEERRVKGVTESDLDPFDRLPRSMPVLTRITAVRRQRSATPTESSVDELGDRLLESVEAIVAAGFDPERELERAFRRQSMVTT